MSTFKEGILLIIIWFIFSIPYAIVLLDIRKTFNAVFKDTFDNSQYDLTPKKEAK